MLFLQSYSQNTAPVGETLIINGRNFFDISLEDIIVKFGNATASVISATSTTLTVVIPEGAESGPVVVQFGDIQTVIGPEFTVGQIVITVPDYLVNTKKYVLDGGTFKVDDNYIDADPNFLSSSLQPINMLYANIPAMISVYRKIFFILLSVYLLIEYFYKLEACRTTATSLIKHHYSDIISTRFFQ